MKKLLYLAGLTLLLAIPGLTQAKTDTIRIDYEVQGIQNQTISFKFSEKVVSHVKVAWVTESGKTGQLSLQEAGNYKQSFEAGSGQIFVYYPSEQGDYSCRIFGETYGDYDISLTHYLEEQPFYVTSLSVKGCTALTSLKCNWNALPLSAVYELQKQCPTGNFEHQGGSIILRPDQVLDLSSEQTIGQKTTSYVLRDNLTYLVLPNEFYAENNFKFQFHGSGQYCVELQNENLEDITFTWYISVIGIYYTVQAQSGNLAYGTASVSGNGVYAENDMTTVTATPHTGYRFVNWTKKDGGVFSEEAVHTFAVTENLELTANFANEGDVANEGREADNFRVYAQDRSIHLSEDRGTVQVYNAAGVCVYSGHATVIPVRNSGLYIVKAGQKACKVMVR